MKTLKILSLLLLFYGSAFGQISSQVGVNVRNKVTSSGGALDAWTGWCNSVPTNADAVTYENQGLGFPCSVPETQGMNFLFNGTTYDRIRGGINADAQAATGFTSNSMFLFNGATWDRWRGSSGAGNVQGTITPSDAFANPTNSVNAWSLNAIWNGATWDRWKSAAAAHNTTGTGLPGVGILLDNAGTFLKWANIAGTTDSAGGNSIGSIAPNIYNGSTWDRVRSASSTNLTATTSVGVQVQVPLSTWSCTSSPGSAAQATCTKAAGGGTVRHVATAIIACITGSADSGGGNVDVINLRDGATGAGTVKATWFTTNETDGAAITHDSRCAYSPPNFSMIGTANTAMTLEYAAASPANVQQTVTLMGYSLP